MVNSGLRDSKGTSKDLSLAIHFFVDGMPTVVGKEASLVFISTLAVVSTLTWDEG